MTAAAHPQPFAGTPVLVGHRDHLLVGRLDLVRDPPPPEALIDRYLDHGPGFVTDLEGEFGLAISDGHRLFVATDKMGIDNVVVATNDGVTAVASDLAALDSTVTLTTTPDPEHLVVTVDQPVRRGALTPFNEIRHLLPGHLATSDRPGTLHQRQYWAPEPQPARPSVDADIAALRDLFVDAVEIRAADADQPGAELSGGLDSSAVVGVLGSLVSERGGRLPTFSHVLPVGHDDPFGDERAFAEAVIGHVPAADPHWIERDLDAEAEADPGDVMSPPAALYSTVAAAGVDVLFSGFGGDEFASFNGRYYFAQLLLHGRWLTLARELDQRARRRQLTRRRLARNPAGQTRQLLTSQYRRLRPDRTTAADLFLTPDIDRLVDVDALTRTQPLGLRHPVRDYQHMLFAIHPGTRRSEHEHVQARRHGLVMRYPLEDPRIAELALSLPPDRWARDGWHRWIWRQATVGILPEMVRNRADKRPPLPGGDDPVRRAAAKERLVEQATAIPAGSFARTWIDVERAATVVGAAGLEQTGRDETTQHASRALRHARVLDRQAQVSGW